MEISGHTQMLCLIGSPVGHSGSPAMYNYSFQMLGLDQRRGDCRGSKGASPVECEGL